jgi:hypothetical protein
MAARNRQKKQKVIRDEKLNFLVGKKLNRSKLADGRDFPYGNLRLF